MATTYGAVAGDSVLVANSFLYPLVLFGPEGRRLGEIGTPPPSWREAPELERGALAGVAGGRGLDVLEEWLASFTVVSGLFVVRDRWVVLSHGRARYDPLGGGPRFPYSFEHLDVYDLRSGEKVLEEVGLPRDARVLAGGPYLHVLIAYPPDPWTILRLGLSGLERGLE